MFPTRLHILAAAIVCVSVAACAREQAPSYDADSSTNALVRLLREGRGRPA